jgi:hypothetical protein
VIIALVALLVFSNGYFLYFRPQLNRAAVLTIMPLLDSATPQDLARAESELTGALTAGLGRRDARDARFALAWTQAKLGGTDSAKYGEALTTLTAGDPAGGTDPDAADLRFWLLAKLGRHDEIWRDVERQPELAERPRVRPLYASALAHRAYDLWTRLDLDGAVEAAKEASRFGVESEVVEILLEQGMRAIVAEDLAEARRCFARAEKESAGESVQRIEARLGQLACRRHQSGQAGLLEALAEEFDGLGRRSERRGPERDDARQLRAHVGWWYLAAMLEDWVGRLPAGQGIPPAERERFLTVVRSVTDADPELGEVIMMHGLLEFGLARTDQARMAAVDTLDRSTRTAKGVVLPELRGIIDRQRGGTGARGRPGDWSDDPPATSPGEPVDYPAPPPAAMSLEDLLRMAGPQMANPSVRGAVEDLMRALGVEDL